MTSSTRSPMRPLPGMILMGDFKTYLTPEEYEARPEFGSWPGDAELVADAKAIRASRAAR